MAKALIPAKVLVISFVSAMISWGEVVIFREKEKMDSRLLLAGMTKGGQIFLALHDSLGAQILRHRLRIEN